MATLVLSTVGTALGGPVGGAIGALIGQSFDQQLLAPVSRGPRLGDLSVQSSSYGTQIPRIYGSMRVAGSVIWATDLVEGEQTTGAKGQPDVTYSYTVSLAVALSSRPAGAIGRIWADGKLLRGAEGDFKVPTTFRFYDGKREPGDRPLDRIDRGDCKHARLSWVGSSRVRKSGARELRQPYPVHDLRGHRGLRASGPFLDPGRCVRGRDR